MQVISEVTFDEVRTSFRRDHCAEREHEANSNQSAEEALELADKAFGGWSKVRLSRAEILQVMLPWHLSEGGGFELVPRTGLTVGQAAQIIRSREAELAEANPVCTAKLTLFRDSPFTSIFFSTRPIPHDDYADVRVGEGLIHLDGLHRLLAWELAQRLPLDEGLTAYIAGDVSPHATTGGQPV